MKIKGKTIIAILIIVAVVIATIIYFLKINDSFEYRLKKIGIELEGIDGFKVKEIAKNKMLAERGDEVIKIEIVDSEIKNTREDYIKRETMLLKSIFEPQLPPYPEFLTKESGCAERYKPTEKEVGDGIYFVLYAGERLGYGVCVDDLIKYRASLGYFYCENSNKTFKIQYFINKEEDDKKIIDLNDSFRCLNN